jgi:hypothetical protein
VETTRSVVVHHTSTTVVMTRHLVVEGQEEVFADGAAYAESQAGATQRDDGTGADGERAWGTLAQRQLNFFACLGSTFCAGAPSAPLHMRVSLVSRVFWVPQMATMVHGLTGPQATGWMRWTS